MYVFFCRTREELESLYRKIVSYVLLRSGLGSPTDIAVVREATGKFFYLLFFLYLKYKLLCIYILVLKIFFLKCCLIELKIFVFIQKQF